MNLLLGAILSKEILLGIKGNKTLKGLWGYRIFEAKIIGIQDIKYGDIQRKLQGYETAQLRGYGIFEENLKGVRDTQTLPPPLMGPLYSVTCLKGKKNP